MRPSNHLRMLAGLLAVGLLLAPACKKKEENPTTTTAATTTSAKRIFITASSYTGDLGGISGADAKCAAAVSAAGLGGTWKAWISDSSTNAIDRISDVGPWKRLDGKTAFNNKANLTTSPLEHVNVTENLDALVGGQYAAWTGTSNGGTFTSADRACKDWTSSSGGLSVPDYGTSGFVYSDDSGNSTSVWTRENIYKCDSSRRLYCIEQ